MNEPRLHDRPERTSPALPSEEWLEAALRQRLAPELLADLAQRAQTTRAASDREFFKAFALLPRATGKAPCDLTERERMALERTCEGWAPPLLRVDEVARLWFVLAASSDADALFRRVEALFSMADVGELVTLYRGLSMYPGAERFTARAAEGVRSNMKAVYEAVALHNPYPARWLSDEAFNHLVVKALHVESRLDAIVGLWTRRNDELVRMLRDYASERQAAKRSVDPIVGQLIDGNVRRKLSSTEGTEA